MDLARQVLVVAALWAAAPGGAAAFSCALSPSRDSVVIRTDNRDAAWKVCTVACTFVVPDGHITVTCWQTIPGGATGWEVCVRPTGGKAFGALADSHEHCVKRE